MPAEVRRSEIRLRDNAWGEPRMAVVYELRCPDCGTWNPLTPQAQTGQEVLVCRQLGCAYRAKHDFTPFVEAIERKRAAERESGHA